MFHNAVCGICSVRVLHRVYTVYRYVCGASIISYFLSTLLILNYVDKIYNCSEWSSAISDLGMSKTKYGKHLTPKSMVNI